MKGKLIQVAGVCARQLVQPEVRWLYGAGIVLGVVPIVVAWWLGAHRSGVMSGQSVLAAYCPAGQQFTGYFAAFHWMIYPLVLPVGLYLLRWMSGALCGTGRDGEDLPIVGLFPTREARERARRRFRELAVDGRVFSGALILTVVTFCWDTAEMIGMYRLYWREGTLGFCPRETDWAVWFLRFGAAEAEYITPAQNLLLIGFAYANQFVIMFFGWYVVVLLIGHNITYLKVIYRRTVAQGGNPEDFIAVNFDDADYDRCFGLLSLNKTFNAQLYFLVLSGILMLFSRYYHVSEAQERSFSRLGEAIRKMEWSQVLGGFDFSFFPDAGQSLIAVAWLFCFGVVCLPALLKFLPLLDKRIRHGGLASFLLEFLKPSDPKAVEPMPSALMEELAGKFARNSFWPTGDRRAHLLFYFAIVVFFLLLIPVKPKAGNLLFFFLYFAGVFTLAVVLTRLFFKGLRFGLSHFDERLVGGGEVAASKRPEGRLSRPAVEPQRGLLTLLFTDIIGSTKLKQELGDLEGVRFIQEHHTLVRKLLSGYSEAQEIKTAGDSFFIVFVRPSDAVKFALQLQAALRKLPARGGLKLEERIGIHIGEVVVQQGMGMATDFYGTQVDICSRVMSLACGDQILLTRAAFDNARQALKGERIEGVGQLSWVQHGYYPLKGVDEALEICEVGETNVAWLRAPAGLEQASGRRSGQTEQPFT